MNAHNAQDWCAPVPSLGAPDLEDGQPYAVQHFERAHREWHPENQAPYDVSLGQFARRIVAGR